MKHCFLSFLGKKDLEGFGLIGNLDKPNISQKSGPLDFILKELSKSFEDIKAIIINDFKDIDVPIFSKKLSSHHKNIRFEVYSAQDLVVNYNPMSYEIIHILLEKVVKRSDKNYPWLINLSSGTPVITTMMMLYAKTHLKAEFFQTHVDKEGNEKLEKKTIPFEFSYNLLSKEIEDKVSSSIISEDIIGESKELEKAVFKARRAAMFDVSCLILGETGTGKELIAREIHRNSIRKKEPFVTFNCSVFSDELARSELFGHLKESFTGATSDKDGIIKKCDKGILFLDEIGDLSQKIQSQLLRFLHEGKYAPVGSDRELEADVKIIAATHKDLLQMVANGEFREDLYYRLAIEIISLPALRDRKDDIPLLAEIFIKKLNDKYSQDKFSFIKYEKKNLTKEALEELKQYSWKGNIRELQHTLTRAVIWANQEKITPEIIRECIIQRPIEKPVISIPDFPINLKDFILKYEYEVIEEALKRKKYNQAETARLLGMNATTLNKKLKNRGQNE